MKRNITFKKTKTYMMDMGYARATETDPSFTYMVDVWNNDDNPELNPDDGIWFSVFNRDGERVDIVKFTGQELSYNILKVQRFSFSNR